MTDHTQYLVNSLLLQALVPSVVSVLLSRQHALFSTDTIITLCRRRKKKEEKEEKKKIVTYIFILYYTYILVKKKKK